MLEIARYGGRHRLKGSFLLAVGTSLFAGLVIWIYPSMASSVNLDELIQAYPEPMLKALGVSTFASLEGFLAAELYNFVWIILLGLYLPYAAAGTIADDVEHDRMDLWLALPVRRWRLLTEQFLTLVVPITVVNTVTPIAVYAGSVLIDDPLAVQDLLMLHALSVPYLLCMAAIGLVFGVVVSRASLAERASLAVAFALFLVESLLTGTDYGALGALSPTRYYDVNAILVESTYDFAGGGVLLAATLGLLGIAAVLFSKKDLE